MIPINVQFLTITQNLTLFRAIILFIESEIMEASDGENGADERDEKQAVLKLLMLNHIHAVIMEYLLLNSCV